MLSLLAYGQNVDLSPPVMHVMLKKEQNDAEIIWVSAANFNHYISLEAVH